MLFHPSGATKIKRYLHRKPDSVQLCGREHVVDGKILHQRIVIVDCTDRLIRKDKIQIFHSERSVFTINNTEEFLKLFLNTKHLNECPWGLRIKLLGFQSKPKLLLKSI